MTTLLALVGHQAARGTVVAGLAAALVLTSAALRAQPTPAVADAIAQLRTGDTFLAVLTLNEIVSQNSGPSGDRQLVARAQALRAMAFLAQSQPERAQAAVALALKAAPDFVPPAEEVDAATLALFSAYRGPRAANPEADGQAADQAGNYQQAFLAYLEAYRALPAPAPRADDQRLRERIIRVVQQLPARPAIPADAQEHARKAQQLLDAEAILGGAAGASSITAADELARALRIAPWWAQATFQLATVQQKLSRVDDALMNLNLYKLADPDGYAAAAAKTSANATPAVTGAPAVPAQPGTVHVYRRYNYVGSAARADVGCDGLRIAELQNRRVVTFVVPAGPHVITVHKDTFAIDVIANQEYYFKTNPGMGGWSTKPVAADEARKEIKEHNLKPNEAKRVTSSECRIIPPKR